MSAISMGFELLLNTLKKQVVDPKVVKTVSKVSVSVLKVKVSNPKLSFLQLLLNNKRRGKIRRRNNLKAVFTKIKYADYKRRLKLEIV